MANTPSDLVERLLATAPIVESYSDTPMAGRIIREAADRIEELEAVKALNVTSDEELIRLQEWERRTRREALEEAARVAQERESEGGEYAMAARHIAAAIRNLADEP